MDGENIAAPSKLIILFLYIGILNKTPYLYRYFKEVLERRYFLKPAGSPGYPPLQIWAVMLSSRQPHNSQLTYHLTQTGKYINSSTYQLH